MTRDEAVTLILNRVGQRGGAASPVDTDLKTQVETELRFTQEQLELGTLGYLPWFLETIFTDAGFVTSASTELVAVPSGFIRELDEERVTFFFQDTTQDDTWRPLEKLDYDEGKTEFGEAAAAKPEAYTIVGLSYSLWPAPDAVYPLKALIYKGDTVLSSNVQNNWLKYAGMLMIGLTGEVVAGPLTRDSDVVSYFQGLASRGRSALHAMHVAAKEAGRAREMGS